MSSISLGFFLMPQAGLNSRMTEITSQVASCFYLSTQIRTNSESQKILNLKCSLRCYPLTFLDKQGILKQADKETVVSIIKNLWNKNEWGKPSELSDNSVLFLCYRTKSIQKVLNKQKSFNQNKTESSYPGKDVTVVKLL